jgi:hypothetical protein
MAIWNILRIHGIFYDHLVDFVLIWYIFSGYGTMYQEKSGNPASVRPSQVRTFRSPATCLAGQRLETCGEENVRNLSLHKIFILNSCVMIFIFYFLVFLF